ncbi:DUF4815 domain-containing protein [Wolbachia endosymbiont of Listronotus oregonensis]|nr:DUF4815 domain-containing protein [Wolbachia endosymbiont of Listronotus oregonensis]
MGTRNYQEVGAARLKVSTIWGYQYEGLSHVFLKEILSNLQY